VVPVPEKKSEEKKMKKEEKIEDNKVNTLQSTLSTLHRYSG